MKELQRQSGVGAQGTVLQLEQTVKSVEASMASKAKELEAKRSELSQVAAMRAKAEESAKRLRGELDDAMKRRTELHKQAKEAAQKHAREREKLIKERAAAQRAAGKTEAELAKLRGAHQRRDSVESCPAHAPLSLNESDEVAIYVRVQRRHLLLDPVLGLPAPAVDHDALTAHIQRSQAAIPRKLSKKLRLRVVTGSHLLLKSASRKPHQPASPTKRCTELRAGCPSSERCWT